MTRRQALALAAGAVACGLSPVRGARATDVAPWRHAISLLDPPKYPPGFARFDYVEPDAPKGGTVRIGRTGTFDTLNLAVSRGVLADPVHLVYEQLMVDSLDEVATAYGQIAEAVRYPADFSSATFRIDPRARWHDGRPVTVDDVLFSFRALKSHGAQRALQYRNVRDVAVTGPGEVTFGFAIPGNREMPFLVGAMVVLPRHWWREKAADGTRQRDISQTTLEPPLGSGPYRLAEVEPGRYLRFERVEGHWGATAPTGIGMANFDEIRIDYYRDDIAAYEAFRAGDLDWRVEESAKTWATGYDFPAVAEGRVVREEFPVRRFALMHGLAFNLRRERFRPVEVRRAFALAFDFEDINRTLMYGAATRADSFWAGSDLACRGAPDGREMDLLEPLRDRLPATLFREPARNPVGGSPELARRHLKEATRLLKTAGYAVRDRHLHHAATGEPFEVEILLNGGRFERQMLVYRAALERLGIAVTLRSVDSAQYANRIRERDFDVVVHAFGLSLVPGEEQRDNWSSDAADRAGSSNVIGIKDAAVDALVEHIVAAKDRADLVGATRALDRVLLARHYVVPLWRHDRERTARWDRYERPAALPAFGASAFPAIWWVRPLPVEQDAAPPAPAPDSEDGALGSRP